VSAAAVIPVKPIDKALGRLAPVLRPGERRALQAAMLADLLDACRDSVAVVHTFVVTSDAVAMSPALWPMTITRHGRVHGKRARGSGPNRLV